MLLTQEEFIGRVIPTDGAYYYNVKQEGDEGFPQWEAATSVKLLEGISNRGRGGDVYAAIASFKPKTSREAENALSKKVLQMDMDCGKGKGFKSQLEAIERLKEFCKAVGIPMANLIVNSGYGWHVYWVLTEAISAVAWKRIATKLKECCIQFGLAVDNTVTADLSRVLRVPETYNWKDRSNPKLVEVKLSTPDIDIREITGPLVAYAGPMIDELPDLKPTGKTVDNSDLGTPPEYSKQFAEHIVEECVVFNSLVATGGADASEPLWMNALHLLAYCEDGGDFAHRISSAHAGYSPSSTNAKFKARVLAKGDTGPTLCATFAQHCSNECELCSHNGKIKSPIALGTKPKDATKLPKGYLATDNGVYLAGDEDTQPIQITNWRIEDIKMLMLAGEGSVVTFTAVEKHARTPIIIPNRYFGDLRALNKHIAEQGIIVRTNSERSIAILLTSWSQQLRNSGQARLGFNAFGWFKDKEKQGFSTGAGVFWGDGTHTSPVVYDISTMNIYKTKGSIEIWKRATNLVLKRGDNALITAMASAFASPLMKFTSESGGVISIVSPDSGSGKSSALKTGQAVWGDPTDGINALDDTDNAVIKRMGYLNNLPVYWDEVRGEKSYEGFLKALFRLGQGREKARLNSNTAFQRSGRWETLIVVATNERITEHIMRADSVSDAGLRRVLELSVGKITATYKQDEAKIFKLLNSNYGHAGEIYAKYLVEHRSLVDKMITTIGDHVAKQAGDLGVEARVWLAIVTALVTGATLAKMIGLVDFDPAGLTKYLISNIRGSHLEVNEQPVSSSKKGVKRLIDAYIHQQGRMYGFLECNKLGKRGAKPTYKQTSLENAVRSRAEILGHIDDTGMVRLCKSPFKIWLRKPIKEGGGGGVPKDVMLTLEALKSYKDTKVSLNAPLKNTQAIEQYCFDVSLKELNAL